MTAIAFDGRFLVTDSCETWGGLRTTGIPKITPLKRGDGGVTSWVAGAGNTRDIQHLITECQRAKRPWDATFRTLTGADTRADAILVRALNDQETAPPDELEWFVLSGTNAELLWIPQHQIKPARPTSIGSCYEACDMLLRIGFDATDTLALAVSMAASGVSFPLHRLDVTDWSLGWVPDIEIERRLARCRDALTRHNILIEREES